MISTGIYKITSPEGKVYVGQSRNIERRFSYHKCLNRPSQPILRKSFKAFGIENHTFEIIELCDFKDLYIREGFYQEVYNSIYPNGLNKNKTITEKSPQIKVGTPCTEQRRISQSKKCYSYAESGQFVKEFASITLASGGVKYLVSDISQCIKGKKAVAGGFQWRDYKKKQIAALLPVEVRRSQKKKKQIIQLTREGCFIRLWESAIDASETLGVHENSIRNCLCGLSKSAGNYKWVTHTNYYNNLDYHTKDLTNKS